MLIKDIIQAIEAYAPPVYQEGYDNSGLQVGDANDEVTAALLTLDVTEAILDEAIERNCNMVIAHHPVIFSGLKSLIGKNYVQRVVQKAIKNDINIYACHTNLDNVHNGVNAKICEKLDLRNTTILSKKGDTLYKLSTYAPINVADEVRDSLFAAGAGNVGKYKECSYNGEGVGTFRPSEGTSPVIGEAGGIREQVAEMKIEVLVDKARKSAIINALFKAHPYEEVAYELIAIENYNQDLGAGMVGELTAPMDEKRLFGVYKDQNGRKMYQIYTIIGQKGAKSSCLWWIW